MESKSILLSKFICCLFVMLVFADLNAQDNMKQPIERDSVVNAAREIISSVKYCALVTIDSSGTANVRTMNPFPPEDDMCIWMATSSKTKKFDEIKNNPNVTLYYANHATTDGFVTIKGKAFLIDDMVEKTKRKRAYWEQAFPDWNYLILIKIVPEEMYVINYKLRMYGDPDTWHAPTILFEKN